MYIPAMSIADRLDEAMCARGIPSQSELARVSKVPQATISRILKGDGKKGPETATIKKLAAAVGVRFEWLNEGTGEMLLADGGDDGGAARSEGWSELTRVDAAEHRILALFRRLDARAKRDAESAFDEYVREYLTSTSPTEAPGPDLEDRQRAATTKARYLRPVSPSQGKKRQS